MTTTGSGRRSRYTIVTLCNFGESTRREIVDRHCNAQTATRQLRLIRRDYTDIHGWQVWQEPWTESVDPPLDKDPRPARAPHQSRRNRNTTPYAFRANTQHPMSELYLHPDTGEVLDEPVAWAIPVPDVDRGVRAPLVVRCELHGRYEAHGAVVSAVHLQRTGNTLRDLASCLLAATSGSCRTYRRWKADVFARYRALDTVPVAQQPLASYLLLADAIAQCTRHPDALAALAAMPVPQLPGPDHPVGRTAVLHVDTGDITFIAPPSNVSGNTRRALPRGQQWLLAHCREHGWEQFDRLTAHDQRTYEILSYYAHTVIAGSVRSCDDFTARMRLFTIGEIPTVAERPLDAVAYYQQFAKALHQVTADTSWVVGELLDQIARQKP